jgi:hypothetical protein
MLVENVHRTWMEVQQNPTQSLGNNPRVIMYQYPMVHQDFLSGVVRSTHRLRLMIGQKAITRSSRSNMIAARPEACSTASSIQQHFCKDGSLCFCIYTIRCVHPFRRVISQAKSLTQTMQVGWYLKRSSGAVMLAWSVWHSLDDGAFLEVGEDKMHLLIYLKSGTSFKKLLLVFIPGFAAHQDTATGSHSTN